MKLPLLFAFAVIGILLYLAKAVDNCDKKGGVLVRGLFTTACIKRDVVL